MKYNFDVLPNRKAVRCLKWQQYDKDVIPMWVADMDFISPEPVVQALRQRVEHRVFGYPEGIHGETDQMTAIRTTIVERLAERYDWQIQPQELIFIPGVITGFNLACHTLNPPREGVLVQTPVYLPILGAAEQTGKIHQQAELVRSPEGDYQVNWDGFESAMDESTGIFLLCNPHNPVGRVFKRAELERMAEICLKRGILICSDEIHCDLVYPGSQHIPIASLDPEIAQSTITLMAPSKTFNLAGLKFSFAIIQNRELRKKYWRSGKGLVSWVNVLGQVAALAAYREGQEWLEQLLVYLAANRDFLYSFVRDELPGVSISKPEGTYLAWLDFRGTQIADPFRYVLDNARVALSDGKTFGKGGEGFLRLNFGCPRPMLEDALERLRTALQKHLQN